MTWACVFKLALYASLSLQDCFSSCNEDAVIAVALLCSALWGIFNSEVNLMKKRGRRNGMQFDIIYMTDTWWHSPFIVFCLYVFFSGHIYSWYQTFVCIDFQNNSCLCTSLSAFSALCNSLYYVSMIDWIDSHCLMVIINLWLAEEFRWYNLLDNKCPWYMTDWIVFDTCTFLNF